MKNFIKSKLHNLLTEAVKYATAYDYTRTQEKIEQAKYIYGGDPYFESIEAGQWIGNAIVNIHGKVSISTNLHKATDVHNNQLGIASENPNYLKFTLRAGRGIEHPDTLDDKNNNSAVTRVRKYADNIENTSDKIGSPASDAMIKTYLIFGDVILDFVEKNMKGGGMGYLDNKGTELAKNTPEKNMYKFDKKNKEQERLERAREKKRQDMERREKGDFS